MPWILGAALLFQLGAVLAATRFPAVKILAAVLAVMALPVLVQRHVRVLGAAVFVLMVVQVEGYRFPFVPPYTPLMSMGFIGLSVVLWLRQRLDRSDPSWPVHRYGWVWTALIAWTGFAALNGLLRGNDPGSWKAEATLALGYVFFFTAGDAFRTRRDFRALLFALFAGMAVVTLEYVGAVMTGVSGDIHWGRILSRQANLIVVVAPFLFALSYGRRGGGSLWLLGCIPLLIVLVLSQQRSLVLGLIAALGTTTVLAYRLPGLERRRILLPVVGLVVAGIVAWTAVSWLGRGAGVGDRTTGASQRLEEVSETGGAPALLIRLVSFSTVWERRIKESPVLGWGLGDRLSIPVLRSGNEEQVRVDNSYLTVWWKAGVIGLILFLLFYLAVFRQCVRMSAHADPDVRVYALGVAGAIAGLMVLALAATTITHYRFNVVWAILFAAVFAAERVFGTPGARGASR